MKKRNHSKKQSGVTLIELMIVIVISVILASVAFPSYKTMVIGNRIASLTSDLHSSLLLARSEALKRGRTVAVCKSTTPNDANPSCSAAANDVGWGAGWIVYVDTDNSGTRGGSEEIIMVRGPYFAASTEGTVTTNIASENISFGFTGQTFSAAQFSISAPSGYTSKSKVICVAIGGRARVADGTSC